MKEASKQPSAEGVEPQKRRADWPLADRMKAMLDRALAHQPPPIPLEGKKDDDDTDPG
jgi:hypothetical protein